MLLPSLATANVAPPSEVTALVFRVLAGCIDITSVWSIGHDPDVELGPLAGVGALLAFADTATLTRLRRCANLHSDTIDFLVVVDGDVFENAWGVQKLSGSLARWAWRQTSATEAFYDESRWADAGRVVRVRRKAFRVWPTNPEANE